MVAGTLVAVRCAPVLAGEGRSRVRVGLVTTAVATMSGSNGEDDRSQAPDLKGATMTAPVEQTRLDYPATTEISPPLDNAASGRTATSASTCAAQR